MLENRAPRRYRGGRAKFETDLRQLMEAKNRAILRLSGPDVRNPVTALAALADCHFCLGYSHQWLGESDRAAGEFREAVLLTNQYIDRVYEPHEDQQGLTVPAQAGAIAAALTGDQQESRRLFKLSGQAAAGQRGDAPPARPAGTLDRMGIYPLARAYSLLRLGQLSDFQATVYPAPWPEAATLEPVWTTTSMEGLLLTAEVCFAMSEAEELETYPQQRGLVPVLRTLTACLAEPDRKSLRRPAQQALQAYYELIRDIGEYQFIWPVVLDLRTAYPEIYTIL